MNVREFGFLLPPRPFIEPAFLKMLETHWESCGGPLLLWV